MNHFPVLNGGESLSPLDKYVPCVFCGLCCSGLRVKLTSRDITRLANELGISESDFMERYVDVISIGYLLRHIDYRCAFLGWKGYGVASWCSIYSARPDACRNFIASLYHPECRDGLSKLAGFNAVDSPSSGN
ncbi:YkgJ family cysteine cluster protein [Chloroflexota bacterium]